MKAISITFLLLLYASMKCYACICKGNWKGQTIDDSYEYFDFIAVGKIISVERNISSDSALLSRLPTDTLRTYWLESSESFIKYLFVVEKLVKGKIKSDTISIYSGEGDCGFNFLSEKKYLIYGIPISYKYAGGSKQYEFENAFLTSRCFRTTDQYDAELIILNQLNQLYEMYK